MWFRTCILTVLIVSMLGVSGNCGRCYARLEKSAHNFQQYFQVLKEASLNPIERFVFSLVLANTHAPEPGGVPERGK